MSMTMLMFLVDEKPQNPLLLVGAGLLTAGIYIFHRSSIQEIEPMQCRHLLAIRHKRLLQPIAFILFMSAVVVFGLHHPLATLLVFGSLAGIVVYGRKTLTKPLRTFLFLKPPAVGIAITLFAWALNDFSNSVLTIVAFSFVCSADAFVCDLADREFDSATGCLTLAATFGDRWTWCVSGILYVIAAIEFQSTIGLLFLMLFPIPLFVTKWTRTAVDVRPFLVLLIAWSL